MRALIVPHAQRRSHQQRSSPRVHRGVPINVALSAALSTVVLGGIRFHGCCRARPKTVRDTLADSCKETTRVDRILSFAVTLLCKLPRSAEIDTLEGSFFNICFDRGWLAKVVCLHAETSNRVLPIEQWYPQVCGRRSPSSLSWRHALAPSMDVRQTA